MFILMMIMLHLDNDNYGSDGIINIILIDNQTMSAKKILKVLKNKLI